MPRLLAEKLRHIRHKRQMTQVELGEQLGLASHAHIANLEAGRDVPSLEVVIRIACLLGVSMDYLLRDSIPVEDPTPRLASPASDRQILSFSARLRALRLDRQLSQRDLARMLGLASRAYIGGLESDRGKLPSLELAVRMADLFGVTIDDLLCGVIPSSAGGVEPGNE